MAPVGWLMDTASGSGAARKSAMCCASLGLAAPSAVTRFSAGRSASLGALRATTVDPGSDRHPEHQSPPGEPSVLEMLAGAETPPARRGPAGDVAALHRGVSAGGRGDSSFWKLEVSNGASSRFCSGSRSVPGRSVPDQSTRCVVPCPSGSLRGGAATCLSASPAIVGQLWWARRQGGHDAAGLSLVHALGVRLAG